MGESTKQSTFTLPEHLQLQLDDEAAAEKIAEHFSSISKEFPPIDANCLPQRVKEKIFHPQVANQAPIPQDYEVQTSIIFYNAWGHVVLDQNRLQDSCLK